VCHQRVVASFALGREDPGDHHRHHEGPLTRGPGREEHLEAQLAHRGADGVHVAVMRGGRHVEELVDGPRCSSRSTRRSSSTLAGGHALRLARVRFLEPARPRGILPQQMAGREPRFGDGGDVHANILRHSSNMSSTNYILHVNIMHDKRTITLCVSSPFSATEGRNFS